MVISSPNLEIMSLRTMFVRLAGGDGPVQIDLPDQAVILADPHFDRHDEARLGDGHGGLQDVRRDRPRQVVGLHAVDLLRAGDLRVLEGADGRLDPLRRVEHVLYRCAGGQRLPLPGEGIGQPALVADADHLHVHRLGAGFRLQLRVHAVGDDDVAFGGDDLKSGRDGRGAVLMLEAEVERGHCVERLRRLRKHVRRRRQRPRVRVRLLPTAAGCQRQGQCGQQRRRQPKGHLSLVHSSTFTPEPSATSPMRQHSRPSAAMRRSNSSPCPPAGRQAARRTSAGRTVPGPSLRRYRRR